MIIHVYAACHNEEVLMPYFLRHYGQFAQKFFLFDHYSTDGTAQIADADSRVTRTLFGVKGVYDDGVLIGMKNEAYKASRGTADWVIVVDLDEFLYHPQLLTVLERCKRTGITIPRTRGYDMISEKGPVGKGQIYDEIQAGVPDEMYDKCVVFNPKVEIGYLPGAHECKPVEEVCFSADAEFKLLHYRCLSEAFFVSRIAGRTQRLSERNLKMNWSCPTVPSGDTLEGSLQKEFRRRLFSRRPVV